MCIEWAYPESYQSYRERIRFNREGHNNSEWEWTAQSEEDFSNPGEYDFCRLAYSNDRLINDGTNGVRTQGGSVKASDL